MLEAAWESPHLHLHLDELTGTLSDLQFYGVGQCCWCPHHGVWQDSHFSFNVALFVPRIVSCNHLDLSLVPVLDVLAQCSCLETSCFADKPVSLLVPLAQFSFFSVMYICGVLFSAAFSYGRCFMLIAHPCGFLVSVHMCSCSVHC